MYGESEDDLREMVGSLVAVNKARGLNMNADKREVMAPEEKVGPVCGLIVDDVEFKYFGFVFDEASTT